MQVRLKTGAKAGEVIEVEDSLGQAFLSVGRAELVEPEVVETAAVADVPEVKETPEEPKASRRRKVAPKPETR